METGAHPAALPWRVINSITSWAGAGYRRRVSIPRNARNEAGCVSLSHRHHCAQSPADHAPTSAVVGRRWEPPQRRPNPMHAAESGKVDVLNGKELSRLDAYWRAANYLSVGQIYLLDNPLLREALKPEHIKPRLLGHWGTTPGLNFIYAHLNRVIKAHDLNVIYVTGAGHGGPGLVANVYLEGTYSEVYPNIGQDEEGMKRLFKQFSFPGGIPSHVAPETPGSIHEGGELAELAPE